VQAWRLGLLDRPARRLIARVVQPGMLALDVGANVGWYRLALARRVGATGGRRGNEPCQ
jgi:hypothetical protein